MRGYLQAGEKGEVATFFTLCRKPYNYLIAESKIWAFRAVNVVETKFESFA
jgi:hypothetical protein